MGLSARELGVRFDCLPMRRYWPEILFYSVCGIAAITALGWQRDWFSARRLDFLVDHQWILVVVLSYIIGSGYWIDQRRFERLNNRDRPKRNSAGNGEGLPPPPRLEERETGE